VDQVAWNKRDLLTYAVGVGAKNDDFPFVYGKFCLRIHGSCFLYLSLTELGTIMFSFCPIDEVRPCPFIQTLTLLRYQPTPSSSSSKELMSMLIPSRNASRAVQSRECLPSILTTSYVHSSISVAQTHRLSLGACLSIN